MWGFTLCLYEGRITFDGPIWYILRLITFIIIAPCVYYLIKNKKIGVIFLVGFFLIEIIVAADYFSFLRWLPYFMLGGFVSLHYINIFQSKEYSEEFLATCCCVFIYIIFACLGISNTCWGGRIAQLVNEIYLLSGVLFLFLSTRAIRFPKAPAALTKYSFFVYAIHYLIIDWINYCILRIGVPRQKYDWFIYALIVAFISVCIGNIIKKITPKVFSWLVGGRI